MLVDRIDEFAAGEPAFEIIEEDSGLAWPEAVADVGDVGSDENVFKVPERAVGREGLDFGDIEGGGSDGAGAKGGDESGFVDE